MKTKDKTPPTNGQQMIDLMNELWPLNRSISGEGLRKTLKIILSYFDNHAIYEVESGSKVLDWIVPEEWEITSAKLINPEGKTIADFEENNLHVVGYSEPVNTELSLEELLDHIYTLPDQPDAIPYVTSYYQRNWGFCLSERQKKELKPGYYKAIIESRHFKGSITWGEIYFKGKTNAEVFVSTYCCHPSMANNELSGPCVATALAYWISQRDNHYSYRFVFAPETIGSAAVLEAKKSQLKENVIAAFNLTCVGDDRSWSFLPSRKENTYADQVATYCLDNYVDSYIKYSWLDRGSDERMYCAPMIDLPMVNVMRTKHGKYPEYHTSHDVIGNVVTAKGLEKSLELHKKMIQVIESDCFPVTTVLGEPQLGKRNLYPMISKKGSNLNTRNIVNLLSYSDGSLSLLEISKKCNVSFFTLLNELEILVDNDLIRIKRLWD
jgi:aminopeptidase-like protein